MTIRALIIGINYSHRSFSLKHAESDAQKFKSYLLQTYPQAQITFLTGDQTTRQEILEQFQALVTATQPSDKFIFYFSGHGTHVFDQSGD